MGKYDPGRGRTSRGDRQNNYEKDQRATVTDITGLLSRDFIRLVLIAILIASPLAWYGMNKWLQKTANPVKSLRTE